VALSKQNLGIKKDSPNLVVFEKQNENGGMNLQKNHESRKHERTQIEICNDQECVQE
jgi:hypothetical protein